MGFRVRWDYGVTSLMSILRTNMLPSQTFWHSSAHLLGQALELEYGVDLTIGPALEEGFYYDCFMGDKVTVTLGPFKQYDHTPYCHFPF